MLRLYRNLSIIVSGKLKKTEENYYDGIKKIDFYLNDICQLVLAIDRTVSFDVIAIIEMILFLSFEGMIPRTRGRKLFVEDREGSRANMLLI